MTRGCPAFTSPPLCSPPLPLHLPPSQSHGPPFLPASLLRVLPEPDLRFPTPCQCPAFGPISEPRELRYRPHRSWGISEITEMELKKGQGWPRMPGHATPTQPVLSRGMCLDPPPSLSHVKKLRFPRLPDPGNQQAFPRSQAEHLGSGAWGLPGKTVLSMLMPTHQIGISLPWIRSHKHHAPSSPPPLLGNLLVGPCSRVKIISFFQETK